MKLELDEAQIDAVTKARIKDLEREVRALTQKLRTRDDELARVRRGMDVSKEKREQVKQTAEFLVDLLQAAGWADYEASQ